MTGILDFGVDLCPQPILRGGFEPKCVPISGRVEKLPVP